VDVKSDTIFELQLYFSKKKSWEYHTNKKRGSAVRLVVRPTFVGGPLSHDSSLKTQRLKKPKLVYIAENVHVF